MPHINLPHPEERPAGTRLEGRTAPAPDLSRDAGEGQTAARATLLVYRHRLAPLSEVGFLRRFYVGFERLAPVWLGCHIDAGADVLTSAPLRVGRGGPLRVLGPTLFRHFGLWPPHPDLRALHPLVLHAHFGRGGALALPIARALGIPLVVTFHGGDATKDGLYRSRLFPTIFQLCCAALQREAALIVCVAEHVREALLARDFPAAKLKVIRYGVEPEANGETPSPRERPYLLFVGRFVEKKGVAHLLEAMRALEREGAAIDLVLIGDGPMAEALKLQSSGLKHARFLGWLANPEVRRLMRSALALCVPSVAAHTGDAEGLPNVVLEAMACAVPVIGSRA